jgi:hypothetical protein
MLRERSFHRTRSARNSADLTPSLSDTRNPLPSNLRITAVATSSNPSARSACNARRTVGPHPDP